MGGADHVAGSRYGGWEVYGGGADSIRYSALNQINRDNVKQLERAWEYDTGDAFDSSEMQCNPIVVDGLLYATSPKLRVFALAAATGKEVWSFDPHGGAPVTGKVRSRGLTYWADGDDRRIFVAAGYWLHALDARTGKPVEGFGKAGRIDLREGLGRDPETVSVGASTPGIVYKDLLILGSIVSEALPAAPGDIRAFDARTGALRWSFHTIPHPGEYGYETWPEDAWKYIGGANNWSGMSLDMERGIVFAGTGSAAFDFYGANRTGDNLFANTLLALNAETGERIWHFQLVKHDVWDRDFPAPPNLVTIERGGKKIDAVAQVTKSGWILVFDRETGEPLFPIEYRDVPASDVEGEVLARRQPFVTKPAPYARQELTEAMLTKRTPEAHRSVLERFRKVRSGPQFTPPGLEGAVVFPGFDGGGEWGGQAFDPETGLYYVNSNEMAVDPAPRRAGEEPERQRQPLQQELRDVPQGRHARHSAGISVACRASRSVSRTRRSARSSGMAAAGCPPFGHLGAAESRPLSSFVKTGVSAGASTAASPRQSIRSTHTTATTSSSIRTATRRSSRPGAPSTPIDLNTGEYAWKIPFGEFPELVEQGVAEHRQRELRRTGGDRGRPAVHRRDEPRPKVPRVRQSSPGELLWETTLPAAGNATPAVYEVNGRQYVVIARRRRQVRRALGRQATWPSHCRDSVAQPAIPYIGFSDMKLSADADP